MCIVHVHVQVHVHVHVHPHVHMSMYMMYTCMAVCMPEGWHWDLCFFSTPMEGGGGVGRAVVRVVP